MLYKHSSKWTQRVEIGNRSEDRSLSRRMEIKYTSHLLGDGGIGGGDRGMTRCSDDTDGDQRPNSNARNVFFMRAESIVIWSFSL